MILVRVLALLLAILTPGMAHEPSMASLELTEVRPGSFVGRWLLTSGINDDGLRPLFPPQCQWRQPRLECGAAGLQGKLGFEGLGVTTSAVLVRYEARGLVRVAREGAVEGYDPAELRRLWTILSLQRDLGVNLAGVEAILKLRAHIELLHRHLEHLAGELRTISEAVEPGDLDD